MKIWSVEWFNETLDEWVIVAKVFEEDTAILFIDVLEQSTDQEVRLVEHMAQ